MITKPDKNKVRQKRHRRVRGKLSGTADRPRLNVFRSNTGIYAQVIDAYPYQGYALPIELYQRTDLVAGTGLEPVTFGL